MQVMKNKKVAVAKWVAITVLPLVLLVVLSRLAQQRRAEAATNELFKLWDKHVGEDNGPVPIHQVEQLLRQGADVKKRDINGRDALHYAAYHGASMIQLVFDYGADVNTQDEDGFTPLMGAIWLGEDDSEGVRLLLRRGTNPNLVWHLILRDGSHRRVTALAMARQGEKIAMRESNRAKRLPAIRDIIQMLKAAGARELDQTDAQGRWRPAYVSKAHTPNAGHKFQKVASVMY